MSDNPCTRCGLPLPPNGWHTPFNCVAALKQEVELLKAEIRRLEESKLAAESEAREKDWEMSKR